MAKQKVRVLGARRRPRRVPRRRCSRAGRSRPGESFVAEQSSETDAHDASYGRFQQRALVRLVGYFPQFDLRHVCPHSLPSIENPSLSKRQVDLGVHCSFASESASPLPGRASDDQATRTFPRFHAAAQAKVGSAAPGLALGASTHLHTAR